MEDGEERNYVVETVDVVTLFDRNVELKNMTFLNSTFEIEKVSSHFSGIHHGISPAISAANGNPIVDRRSALTTLVSTILTNDRQFDVHVVSENQTRYSYNRMFPGQCPIEFNDLL